MSGEIDVSVVIPTFRREKQVQEALASVLAQTGVRLEIIVVDDSPEASARAAVTACGDARVRYVARSNASGGRPALVRNEGAALATGRYLYFLDDDDQMCEGTLQAMVDLLDRHPEAGMAYGCVEPFGEDPDTLQRQRAYFVNARRRALLIGGGAEFRAVMAYSDPVVVCSASMGRRSAFEAVGGFDAGIAVCEDGDLWARIAWNTTCLFLDRIVVRYRTGASSIMHDLTSNDPKLSQSYQRIQEKFRQDAGSLAALFWKFRVRLLRM